MFDNGSKIEYINLYNIINFVIEYIPKTLPRYNINEHRKNITVLIEILDSLVNKKLKLTMEQFITLIEHNVYVSFPQKCGLNVNDSRISQICYSKNANPYNIKFEYNINLLQTECLTGGNLKKIRDISKKVNADMKCLENACSIRNNYNTIKFLCEKFNLVPNMVCLANLLKCQGGSYHTYVANEYTKDNPQKEEVKQEVKQDDIELTDSPTPKKVVKKVIRRIVKKKETESNQDNLDNQDNDTQSIASSTSSKKIVKKIVRRIVKKPKSSDDEKETSETKSTSNLEENNIDIKPKKVIKKTKLETTTQQVISNIINLDTYNYPIDYDYISSYNIKKDGSLLLKDKIKLDNKQYNHIDIRRKILEYFNSNSLLNVSLEINNIKFKINQIDKFISAYILEKY